MAVQIMAPTGRAGEPQSLGAERVAELASAAERY
jgi:hypothetical protein